MEQSSKYLTNARNQKIDISRYRYRHATELLIEKYGTLRKAARHLGYTPNTLVHVLRDETNTTKDIITNLMCVLDITYEELFAEDFE